MPDHVHWEGPSFWVIAAALASVAVIVAGLTIFVQHNCSMFHVCSDYVRDRPPPFSP
jgi:hypothetical protein